MLFVEPTKLEALVDSRTLSDQSGTRLGSLIEISVPVEVISLPGEDVGIFEYQGKKNH